MKGLSFLRKLIKERNVEKVEPSEEMKESYLVKAENSLKAAKVVLDSSLYENSVVDSYFAMYNSLLALLFKVCLKSESHAGSLLLFEHLFDNKDMLEIIKKAKEERIDKQYYIEANSKDKSEQLTKESCLTMIKCAESFIFDMKLLIQNTNKAYIQNLRIKFEEIKK